MKITRHITVFVGIAALTIGPRLAWPNYFERDRKEVSGKAAARRANEIEADWKRLAYVGFDVPGTETLVMNRLLLATTNLSNAQTLALKERLPEMFNYFLEPDFEKYYRIKSEGLHYLFAPKGGSSNILYRAVNESKVIPPLDPKGVTKIIWDRVHRNNEGKLVLPQITSIATNTVKANVSHVNSGPLLVGGPVKNGFTIAAAAFEPGFQYDLGGGAKQDPLLFEFSFLGDANHSGKVGPVYVSLIWSERDQRWLPNRLIIDSWVGVQTLF